MNFLIISEGGDGTGLALRLKEEGHDARIWIQDSKVEKRCMGLVDYADESRVDDIIVTDCTGAGPLMDRYSNENIPNVGGSSWADKLEGDRQYSEEVFSELNIQTPESTRLTDWDDAAEVIEGLGEDSGRVVLKPEGLLSGVVPSYVSYDLEDAHKTLDHWKGLVGSAGAELTIQQFIEGIAISTEGWFNGLAWVEGMFNHTIERKHFLNGDIGPSGGCTGNVIWPCDREDPMVSELLIPLTDLLAEHNYRGAIDVNAVVNEEGTYALEFTPRFGYDAFPTLLYSLCKFDFGVFLDGLARGYEMDTKLEECFGAGVRISLPPWPSEKFTAEEKVPIQGLSPASMSWFYPYDIRKNDKDELESSGAFGILGVMNGNGDTIDEAFANAYRRCNKLRIPNKQYRTDLGEVCHKDFRALARLFNAVSSIV